MLILLLYDMYQSNLSFEQLFFSLFSDVFINQFDFSSLWCWIFCYLPSCFRVSRNCFLFFSVSRSFPDDVNTGYLESAKTHDNGPQASRIRTKLVSSEISQEIIRLNTTLPCCARASASMWLTRRNQSLVAYSTNRKL